MIKEIKIPLYLCIFNTVIIIIILWIHRFTPLSLSTITILLFIILKELWTIHKIFRFHKNEQSMNHSKKDLTE